MKLHGLPSEAMIRSLLPARHCSSLPVHCQKSATEPQTVGRCIISTQHMALSDRSMQSGAV